MKAAFLESLVQLSHSYSEKSPVPQHLITSVTSEKGLVSILSFMSFPHLCRRECSYLEETAITQALSSELLKGSWTIS